LVSVTKADPRVKRTKGLLQRALADLLHEQSFHNITVQDIAARAEVNRATFYAHFDDKYELLAYSVRETFQEKLHDKLPDEPGFTRANLRVLMLVVCQYLGGFLGHCMPTSANFDQGIMVIEVQQYVNEMLIAWITRTAGRSIQPPATPETVAMMTSWALFGSALQWARMGRKITPEQLTEQLLATLTTGLQPYLG
jgi:AcrR family transcriptional regulator